MAFTLSVPPHVTGLDEYNMAAFRSKLQHIFIFWLGFTLAGTGCSSQPPVFTTTPTSSPIPLTATPSVITTTTNTATITPTLTPTSTSSPTPVPTLDPAVGPLILLVEPGDDPARLDSVLTEAIARGYEFADFSNFITFSRPFIVIFDNVQLAGVTDNQVRLIETLEKFGSGVLAVNSQGRQSGGVEFLKTMFEVKGWEFGILGDGYEDISNYVLSDFLPYIGMVQIKCQGTVYQSDGFYPRVWITPYGIFSETMLEFINNHNVVFTEPRMKRLNSPGLLFVVTADARLTYDSVTGPVEFYPSARLRAFDFSDAPY